ncbi:hypothetical protein [Azonexus hydrophilus]|uniref:Uncharacterized protein n=1 Tax=Azonexus hydrophilus TaxID=418702 RepID=A0ABZ2XEK8_9RHOO
MTRKNAIHNLINEAALELLEFIKDCESDHKEHGYWVPAAKIKDDLDLNFVAVPQSGRQHGPKGWVFATLARILEDKSLIEHKKIGNRAFYRSIRK